MVLPVGQTWSRCGREENDFHERKTEVGGGVRGEEKTWELEWREGPVNYKGSG